MVRLAEHRANGSDLEEEPRQRLVASGAVRSQEPLGLVGEVDQDGARLEQGEVGAARTLAVDDGGDLVVGADAQKLRGKLFARAKVDPVHLVREAELLQRDRDFEAVGRGRRVKVDHFSTWMSAIELGCRVGSSARRAQM